MAIRIEAGQLIDAASDVPRRPGMPSIDGDRIEAVGGAGTPSGPPPPPRGGGQDLVLSLPGCTLLPGLNDFHSHLGIDTRWSDLGIQAQAPPARYIAAGIARIQEDLRAGTTTMAVRRPERGRPRAAHLLGGAGVAAVGGGVEVIEHGSFLTDADLDLVARREVLVTLTLGVLCVPRGHAFGADPAQPARIRALVLAAL